MSKTTGAKKRFLMKLAHLIETGSPRQDIFEFLDRHPKLASEANLGVLLKSIEERIQNEPRRKILSEDAG